MHHIILLALLALPILFGAALFSIDVQQPVTPITVVLTAETLVAVGLPCVLPFTTGKACVRGYITIVTGVTATNLVINFYRGTDATGTLVGTCSLSIAGANHNWSLTAQVIDPLANVGQCQYCFTTTVQNATANSTVTAATIETMVISG